MFLKRYEPYPELARPRASVVRVLLEILALGVLVVLAFVAMMQ